MSQNEMIILTDAVLITAASIITPRMLCALTSRPRQIRLTRAP